LLAIDVAEHDQNAGVGEVRSKVRGERALAASPLAIDDGDDGHGRTEGGRYSTNGPGPNVAARPRREKGTVVFSISASLGGSTSEEKSRRPQPVRGFAAAMSARDGLFTDEAGVRRCAWCRASPAYRDYHDAEWGFPVRDDPRLFEKLCLEGFQAGLSWLTILNKREAFRRAFAGFDAERVARFGEREVATLLADAAIVRHRGKIESTINNARRLLELRAETGSLSDYVWRFEPARRPKRVTPARLRALGLPAEATAMAKDLKRRGWTFVGPTTIYAFMQAMGLVDDHLEGCRTRVAAEAARRDVGRSSSAS
jgi:DNA-3-methyladenine glycosylase I